MATLLHGHPIPWMRAIHKPPHLVLCHISFVQDENLNITAVILQQISCQPAAQLQASMKLPHQGLLATGCIYAARHCAVGADLRGDFGGQLRWVSRARRTQTGGQQARHHVSMHGPHRIRHWYPHDTSG